MASYKVLLLLTSYVIKKSKQFIFKVRIIKQLRDAVRNNEIQSSKTDMAELVIQLAEQHISSVIKQRSTTRQGSKAFNSIKLQVDDLLSELKAVDKLYTGAQGGDELDKVRNGIEELKCTAYEVEDAVDILVYNLSPSFNLCFGLNRVSKKLRKLKKQIKEMKGKLDQNPEVSENPTPCARGSQDPKSHIPDKGDVVIAIHHEIRNVVEWLTGKFKSNDSLPPVDRLAIVGMGGSGKTTLARSIYNHRGIKNYFDYRMWVSVTRGWDTYVVLCSILKQVQVQRRWFFAVPDNVEGPHEDPNTLASRLNGLMHKKTCLLVLDDVWDMKSLSEFIASIQTDNDDCCKYTIVITSRQTPKDVNWYILQPQRLTGENSWKLVSSVASKSSKGLSVEYQALAMEMLKKCEGLPLAIVALGKLLKTMETKSEWQRLLAEITGTDATSIYRPVNEILGLSYDELPYYLKPCFLYLGLFLQGSTISGGQLIRMWIAEGFIETRDNEETLEKGGRRYLQELVDHTMVDVVSKTYSGKVKTIRLHDIMRDFCLLKAKEMDFLTISSSDVGAIEKTSRRAAINSSNSTMFLGNNFNLRSLAIIGKSSTSAAPERYTSPVSQSYLDLDQVCRNYKLLRVLDISGIKSPDGTLPKEIGNLINLTYLGIRTTNIRQLHKSIGKLRNLLTLDYRDVSVDTEIRVPNVLCKLEKLRHLYLPNKLSGMIKYLKLHKLKDLITLWGVGGGPWMLEEMDRLSSTLSKLYIHRISTENQLKAVLSCASMQRYGCLYALALDWYGFEFNNVNELLAKQNLTKLRLMGKAPDTLHAQGLAFPSNLVKLELYYTQLGKQETMEHLGTLAVLKVLELSKDSYIGSEWSCRKGSFPVLEELKLANLSKLKKWEIEEGAMPCLKKLSIGSCINLKGMPEGLKHARSLENLDINNMSFKFRNRLQEVKRRKKGRAGEDAHIIKHIPHVTIRDSYA